MHINATRDEMIAVILVDDINGTSFVIRRHLREVVFTASVYQQFNISTYYLADQIFY